jgi:hypothetical protein
LFGASVAAEADRFFEILSAAMSEALPYLALLTQRSDYLGRLQSAAKLTVRFDNFPLGPLPLSKYRQIIEGPAHRANITIEDGLVEEASRDAQTEDALPLLAFALRELYDRNIKHDHLTLAAYHDLGDPKEELTPLENAVRKKADAVLADARLTNDQMKALKGAFVPAMVQVNDKGEFSRRSARWDELPVKALPILERVANARLLIRRQVLDASMVEVAHEALLRKWRRLNEWIEDAREFLTGKQQLERDLGDWERATEADKSGALLSGLSSHGRADGSRSARINFRRRSRTSSAPASIKPMPRRGGRSEMPNRSRRGIRKLPWLRKGSRNAPE